MRLEESKPASGNGQLMCSLPAPEFAARRAEIKRYIEQADAVVPRRDGVLFSFKNTTETAHALIDFILFEQRCCSSITYELRSEPEHSHFFLRLRAPLAQVEALQAIYLNDNSPNP
jgi:hypothetical protein